jgi:hypothetical protein
MLAVQFEQYNVRAKLEHHKTGIDKKVCDTCIFDAFLAFLASMHSLDAFIHF